MGLDIILHIHRKKDDHKIGSFDAAYLKFLFDYGVFSDYGILSRNSGDGFKIDMPMLDSISSKLQSELNNHYTEIFEKKMLIALASNISIKESLEQDILSIYEDKINPTLDCISNINKLKGAIDVIVESLCVYSDEDGLKFAGEVNSIDSSYLLTEETYCNVEYC